MITLLERIEGYISLITSIIYSKTYPVLHVAYWVVAISSHTRMAS